jgi:hypothetical protein
VTVVHVITFVSNYLYFDRLRTSIQPWLESLATGQFLAARFVGAPLLYLLDARGTLEEISQPSNYPMLYLIAVPTAAAALTLVWTVLDRRRAECDVLHRWLRVYARYGLALSLMSYALVKIVPTGLDWVHHLRRKRGVDGQRAPLLPPDDAPRRPARGRLAGQRAGAGLGVHRLRSSNNRRRAAVAGVDPDRARRRSTGRHLLPRACPRRVSGSDARAALLALRARCQGAPAAVLVFVLVSDGLDRRRHYFGQGRGVYGMFQVERFVRAGVLVTPMANDARTWKRIGTDGRYDSGAVTVQFASADVRQYRLVDDAAKHQWILRDGGMNLATLHYALSADGSLSLDGRIGEDTPWKCICNASTCARCRSCKRDNQRRHS